MVRLYRFFNLEQSKYGEPFALCDKHAKEEMNNPPPALRDGSVFREKWADKARGHANDAK